MTNDPNRKWRQMVHSKVYKFIQLKPPFVDLLVFWQTLLVKKMKK